jgi:transposase
MDHQFWTDEERAQLRKLLADGKSRREIEKVMQRSKHSVNSQIKKLELPPASPRGFRPDRGRPHPSTKKSYQRIRAGKTTLPTLPSLDDDDG